MFKNLLFDWSGTLCDDMALTIEATNYVLAQYGREPLDRRSFREEFQLPYPEYYAWKTPEAKLEDLENHYRYAFGKSHTPVTPIPHAMEFMRFCKAQGIRCFTLTSMDPKAFVEQSKALGFHDFFEHIHSGIHNKEHYIPTLMRQHGLRPEETAFIGDMQHDMRAAHCAGVTAIGVLTGYNSPAQLAEAEPDITVPHLGCLRDLLERSNAAAVGESIRLHGLELMSRIGVPDEERAEPQRLTADITLQVPTPFRAMGEDISRTVDYFALATRITELADERPYVLLETLAQCIADCCTQEFAATAAAVELHKYIMPNTVSVSVTARS